MAALEEARSGQPEGCRWVVPGRDGKQRFTNPSKVIRAIFKRAGCYEPGKLLHAMRHTFGTRVATRSGDPVNTQKLLGHSELRTTQLYLHADAERQREAIEAAGLNEIISAATTKESAKVLSLRQKGKFKARVIIQRKVTRP
jgi:integrase